ncbi:MAG: DUF5060 domain-containing protein [Pedobacter sp.]|nr:MAG: DUF5060 domain-containing protein [Pedobacter sp.]
MIADKQEHNELYQRVRPAYICMLSNHYMASIYPINRIMEINHRFKTSLLFGICIAFSALSTAQQKNVERWRIFELKLKGPETGNPFADVQLYAEFVHNDK